MESNESSPSDGGLFKHPVGWRIFLKIKSLVVQGHKDDCNLWEKKKREVVDHEINMAPELPAISQSSASVALANASSSSGSRVTLSIIGSTLFFGTKTFPTTPERRMTPTPTKTRPPAVRSSFSGLTWMRGQKKQHHPHLPPSKHEGWGWMMKSFLSSLTALLCLRAWALLAEEANPPQKKHRNLLEFLQRHVWYVSPTPHLSTGAEDWSHVLPSPKVQRYKATTFSL